MSKRNILIMVLILILCSSYLFAFECYDRQSTKIRDLSTSINVQELEITEVGIEFSGIKYEDEEDTDGLARKLNEMIGALSHEADCSKVCKQYHYNEATTSFQKEEDIISGTATCREDEITYTFRMKNQKDIHNNTYYDLKICGLGEMTDLDNLRSRAYDKLLSFQVKPKESIYFKGYIEGDLSKARREKMAKHILEGLKAEATNYYESDIDSKVAAFYGYTNLISEYIQEANGNKTNVQISYTYDEINNKTNMIIAFPFYNEPF